MIPLDQVRRELWIRFADYPAYQEQKDALQSLLMQEGAADGARVGIMLAKTRQYKYLPESCSVSMPEKILPELKARFGEDQVMLKYKISW